MAVVDVFCGSGKGVDSVLGTVGRDPRPECIWRIPSMTAFLRLGGVSQGGRGSKRGHSFAGNEGKGRHCVVV